MSRLYMLAALLAMQTACFGFGMSESEFFEKFADETCALVIECAEPTTNTFAVFETVDECDWFVEVSAALANDNCKYKASKAKKCVSTLKKGGCGELDTYNTDDDHPCMQVYTGDDSCQWPWDGFDTYTSFTTDTGTWTY